MKTVKFDCVAMKRQGATLVQKEIVGMTVDEELKHWRASFSRLRNRQQKLRAKMFGKPEPFPVAE